MAQARALAVRRDLACSPAASPAGPAAASTGSGGRAPIRTTNWQFAYQRATTRTRTRGACSTARSRADILTYPPAAVRHQLRHGLHRRARPGERRTTSRASACTSTTSAPSRTRRRLRPLRTSTARHGRRQRHGAVSVPARHGLRSGRATVVTSTSTTCSRRPSRCTPKGPAAGTTLIRVILAHAQDIDGSPLAVRGRLLDGQQRAERIHLFPGGSAGGDDPRPRIRNGAVIDFDAGLRTGASAIRQGGRLCTTTDENGNTAIEVCQLREGASSTSWPILA